MEIVDRIRSGDRRAIARCLSLIEDGGPQAQAILSALYPHTGHAHIIGVTGAPGAGKSTLVNLMAREYRQQDASVGIIAVDPTSPFSGGAILGDRIRMQDLSGDPGVFIRSMASRGSLGGLAWATTDAVRVLDAAGFEEIFVETVGAGQAEVEIARTAHTILVLQAPGTGDEVQVLKAGILEIADILVVNKADREGADYLVTMLEAMLDLSQPRLPKSEKPTSWRPPILRTVATQGEGVAQLVEAIARHVGYLRDSGLWHERERDHVASELRRLLQEALIQRFAQQISLDTMIDRIVAREMHPYTAVQQLLHSLGRDEPLC